MNLPMKGHPSTYRKLVLWHPVFTLFFLDETWNSEILSTGFVWTQWHHLSFSGCYGRHKTQVWYACQSVSLAVGSSQTFVHGFFLWCSYWKLPSSLKKQWKLVFFDWCQISMIFFCKFDFSVLDVGDHELKRISRWALLFLNLKL